MRIYRLLLRLYPRSFREEYGADMEALTARQLRDENTARVLGRTALDLALTIPARHLEARMHRPSAPTLVVVYAVAGASLTVAGGPFGFAGGAVLAGLALVTWRRNRPVAPLADARWWKLLFAGVALLGALVVTTSVAGELPNAGWYVAVAAGLAAFGLIAAGIVLGLARRTGTRTVA